MAAVGVLALQGDVREHLAALARVGAKAVAVRRPEDLDGLDGVVLPGGESTTIGKLLDFQGLRGPLQALLAGGLPAFGTCAGAILLASEALHHDGTPAEQPLLGVMDTVVRRNAFGRQVASCEAEVDVRGVGRIRAAFIRAPWIERHGPGVEELAEVATAVGSKVVVARQGRLLVSSFHPELTGDDRLHSYFIRIIEEG